MREAGWAEIVATQPDGLRDAAYPPSSTAVPPPDLQTALDGDPAAAERFAAMSKATWYALILKLANAKRMKTRGRCIAGFPAG